MITLFFISLLIFIGYLGFISIKYGIPTSISETYYLLPTKLNKLFYGWTIVVLLPLLIFWLESYTGALQFLPFLTCGSLGFVGAAAAFKERMTTKVHYVAAGLCALCSQLWIILATPYWLISVILLALFFSIGFNSKGVFKSVKSDRVLEGNALIFFLEIWAFLSVYLTLLISYVI